MDADGAEVREQLEAAAEREERLLGADGRVRVVPLRTADRAEEDRIGGARPPSTSSARIATPYVSIPIPPATISDQSMAKPAASAVAPRTRRAAATTSGPTPSPGIAAIR